MIIVDKISEKNEQIDIRYFQEKAARVDMTTTEYLLYWILGELEGIQELLNTKMSD